MITIPGTLTIVTLDGRFGPFNTAKLTTSIGEFVVKDKELDQYKSGKYQGQFVIDKIKPSHYSYGNRFVVECRAYLNSFELNENDDLTPEDEAAFSTNAQDPLEEEKSFTSDTSKKHSKAASQPAKNKADSKQTNVSTVEATTDNSSDDEKLFGLLWPLGTSVKLDSTCNRETIRMQKARLNALGYEFDYRTQFWDLVINH
ncbi:DUF3275 family protein [Entomomonas sp. E2T0]|uniref:DUF3275 family protein n=1 Tax=Entomomonas sp. E2T0 TaxID=2930213 RepID=UPI0022283975|nr:DUF3275 family protein [Entomomonas sp. E2T0]UYZ83054.1 DUF3275 family protein [Entomomonas sp. E2T0]